MSQSAQKALDRAMHACAPIAETRPRVRADAARKIAVSIASDADELAALIVREGVKTIREARAEVDRAAQTFLIAAEEAVRLTGETIEFGRTEAGRHRWGSWEPRPLGVVVGITTYNDPLNLVAHKVAPAMACGAPIIVKPHEATPGCARMIARYTARTCLPDGAVQIVEGGSNIVQALVSDERVRLVSFTGGSVAGRAVAKAAETKKLAMKLGGIGASYVDAGADTTRAADRLASGIVWAAGQNCVHTQHVIVHASSADSLLPQLVRRLEAMRCGDRMDEQTDIARQINVAAATRIEALIDNAVAAGAEPLVRMQCDDPQTVGPCLLRHVRWDHAIAREEVFGPVAVATIVADMDEAIGHVRSLGPTINTSIFSDSLSAIRRWDLAVDAGTTIVNDSTDFRVDHMPFGGNGAAGIGREGVRSAIEAMTEKHVTVFAA